ncbi:MAG: HAD-IA family hydrolase [Spirochaetales bacterium]|nr:HAD-IA family hydrolase [Spirochaetales bacterium]
MHRKTFIWFDLGYTLIRLDREKNYRRLLETFGVRVTEEELTDAFHLTDKIFMRSYPGTLGKCPRCYMPWYLGMLNHRLGISLDLIRIMELWLDPSYNPGGRWICYDETITVLKELSDRGYRLGIISNWNETARDIIQRLGLTAFMDTIIISSERGCEKPDKRIFEIALSQARVRPEESLYIGDNYYDDVIGCRRVGMDILLINRYGRKGIEEIDDAEIITSLREIFPRLVTEGGKDP